VIDSFAKIIFEFGVAIVISNKSSCIFLYSAVGNLDTYLFMSFSVVVKSFKFFAVTQNTGQFFL